MIDALLNLTRRLSEIEGAQVSTATLVTFYAPRCFRLSDAVTAELARDFNVMHEVSPDPASGARHRDWHQHTVTLRIRP